MDDPIFKLEKVVQTRGDEPLEDFEGPLDLILYLLSKNKIEIQDIPIALILEQYQAYLEKRKRMDLEVASEFITMAAQLMFIKTRMLLNLEDEDDSPAITGCLWDFVLPIGTLIALTIVGGELFLALVAAIAVCFLLYIPRKKLSLTRFCDLAMHGFCNMIPTVAIIFFAFVMQEGMTEIGIAPFVINAVKSILSPAVFPAIAFLVVAALNFTTGSVWGITAVTVPILLPLAFSIGANPLLVMGAIVSGATLGSHACFYSDATVLTSSCCKMENMDHALSQLPYSLCAAGLSAAGYLVCGLLM